MQQRLVVFTFRCFPYDDDPKGSHPQHMEREFGDKLTLPHAAFMKLTAAGAIYPLVMRVARARPRYLETDDVSDTDSELELALAGGSSNEADDADVGYLGGDDDDWDEDGAEPDCFDDITRSGPFDPAAPPAPKPGAAMRCVHGGLSDLSSFEPVPPRVLHCGIHDFTAPPDTVYIPRWAMRLLRVRPGRRVRLRPLYAAVPKASTALLRPATVAAAVVAAAVERVESAAVEAFEAALKRYSCLTEGQRVVLPAAPFFFLLDALPPSLPAVERALAFTVVHADPCPGPCSLLGSVDLAADFTPAPPHVAEQLAAVTKPTSTSTFTATATAKPAATSTVAAKPSAFAAAAAAKSHSAAAQSAALMQDAPLTLAEYAPLAPFAVAHQVTEATAATVAPLDWEVALRRLRPAAAPRARYVLLPEGAASGPVESGASPPPPPHGGSNRVTAGANHATVNRVIAGVSRDGPAPCALLPEDAAGQPPRAPAAEAVTEAVWRIGMSAVSGPSVGVGASAGSAVGAGKVAGAAGAMCGKCAEFVPAANAALHKLRCTAAPRPASATAHALAPAPAPARGPSSSATSAAATHGAVLTTTVSVTAGASAQLYVPTGLPAAGSVASARDWSAALARAVPPALRWVVLARGCVEVPASDAALATTHFASTTGAAARATASASAGHALGGAESVSVIKSSAVARQSSAAPASVVPAATTTTTPANATVSMATKPVAAAVPAAVPTALKAGSRSVSFKLTKSDPVPKHLATPEDADAPVAAQRASVASQSDALVSRPFTGPDAAPPTPSSQSLSGRPGPAGTPVAASQTVASVARPPASKVGPDFALLVSTEKSGQTMSLRMQPPTSASTPAPAPVHGAAALASAPAFAPAASTVRYPTVSRPVPQRRDVDSALVAALPLAVQRGAIRNPTSTTAHAHAHAPGVHVPTAAGSVAPGRDSQGHGLSAAALGGGGRTAAARFAPVAPALGPTPAISGADMHNIAANTPASNLRPRPPVVPRPPSATRPVDVGAVAVAGSGPFGAGGAGASPARRVVAVSRGGVAGHAKP